MAILHKESLELEDVKLSDPQVWKQLDRIWSEFTENNEYVEFPAFDGTAVYAVVSRDPLVLRHVNWLDGYEVHPALIRGLTIEDVDEQIEHRKRLAALLARRKQTPANPDSDWPLDNLED